MINTENNDRSEILDMTPEHSAMEAMLGSFRLVSLSDEREKMKATILCECCRLAEQQKIPSREKLVETIVQVGKNEITLSLTQYVRSIQRGAILFGGLIGLICGVILTIVTLFCFVHFFPTSPQSTSISSPDQQPVAQYYDPNSLLDNGSLRLIPNRFDKYKELSFPSLLNFNDLNNNSSNENQTNIPNPR